MLTKERIADLKKKNETLRKKAIINNLSDCVSFCDLDVHPNMDLSLMSTQELSLAHLFTHNSFYLSKPRFGKENIKSFHGKIVIEMSKRGKTHPNVDSLDKLYK